MAVRKTHYDLLGVSHDASSVDIASAFRERLDAVKGKADVTPEYLASLRDAYQTLANPARREAYDATIITPGPARSRRPIATAAMTQPDDGGGWRSSMLKYGVPIAILAVAIWGWKSRKPAPQATIVSKTVFLPTGSSDDSSGPGRVALSAPPVAASAGAPSRSAEQLFAEVSGSIVRRVTGTA